MFDVGFPELVLVFVIALLVLGPQRLPKVAAELGKWVGRARRTASQLRRQLEREVELAEIQPPNPPTSSGATEPKPVPPSAREMSDALADHAAGRVTTPAAPGHADAPAAQTTPPATLDESSDKPPA